MDKKRLKEDVERFREWLTRGPGEVFYGGIIKSAATREKRRLEKRLETGNLFPHLEHEDKMAKEKAEQAWDKGEQHVKRGRSRRATIDNLLDADAGLRITDEDLNR